MNNNLKKLLTTSILIAIGFIFRQLIPAIGAMKLDGLMAVIVVILIITPSFKNALLTGIATGIIAALTTVFPGGQLPIFIDKVISCMVIYGIIKVTGKYYLNPVVVGGIGFIGTIISGFIFLNGVIILANLPAPFMVMFATVVIPAALVNIPLTIIIFNAVKLASKFTRNSIVMPAK